MNYARLFRLDEMVAVIRRFRGRGGALQAPAWVPRLGSARAQGSAPSGTGRGRLALIRPPIRRRSWQGSSQSGREALYRHDSVVTNKDGKIDCLSCS